MTLSITPQDRAILRELGVRLLVLFGSYARGTASDHSDVDVGVLINRGVDLKLVYDRLYDLLATKINTLVNVDIVFLDQTPQELRGHVMKYGDVLYEEHPHVFAHFKERTMIDAADTSWTRAVFSKATISRIAV